MSLCLSYCSFSNSSIPFDLRQTLLFHCMNVCVSVCFFCFCGATVQFLSPLCFCANKILSSLFAHIIWSNHLFSLLLFWSTGTKPTKQLWRKSQQHAYHALPKHWLITIPYWMNIFSIGIPSYSHKYSTIIERVNYIIRPTFVDHYLKRN